MLAELLLIVDLLNSPSFRSTPVEQVTPQAKPQAVKHTEGSGASLGGVLDFVGPITTITQPVVGVGLTPKEANRVYLEAATGIKEQIGTGGRF
tara:strand:+ start:2148 stop:2426 length:279 start_codon:yes stop_codon:yes gene_type:complete